MMDSMRNAAKSWVAKLLIGLLAVSFGVWGIADVFRGSNQGALATVGSTEINSVEFQNAFAQYIQNFSRQTGQPLAQEDARKLGLDRAVLNNLIQSAAIDDQARRMNLAVSNEFLAQDVMENPAFKSASGQFDPEQFKRLLAQNGISEAMFFAQERQARVREALTGTADGDMPVSKALIEAQYRYNNEQRDARYFIVKAAETDFAAPTDEEIKKEYEANPAAYTAPEFRSIAVMKAEPADIAAKLSLTDDDLAAGFEKLKSDYYTPEKRSVLQLSFPTLDEATAAKARLDSGTDFLALAKERGFSESDITFADKSKAEFLDPTIAETVFKLTEGAVSDPVKGGLATVILKLQKIAPEHQSTLEEVKTELTDRLKLERAREELQSIYEAVEDARAAQTPFEQIAAKAGIPFLLIPASDAQGRGKDGQPLQIPHQLELLKAAFESDVGVENDAISLDEGYVWYEVREVIPSALKPFESVKEQARKQVIANKLRNTAEEKAQKLVQSLKSGATLDALARENGSEVKTVQGLRRNESDGTFDAAAVQALFSIPEGGFTLAIEPDGKSAKVMQSQSVLIPTFDANTPEAKTLGDQIETTSASDVLSSFLASLQAGAGVQVNESLWRQISGQPTQ